MARRPLALLLLPLQILALASGAKSFRDNPVIGSRRLNRLGLHVARVAAAALIMGLRRLWLAPLVPGPLRAAFARDGFVVLPDFLPAEQFAALEAEIRACPRPTTDMVQGDTVTARVLLDHDVLAELPAARAVLADRRYRRVLGYVAGRWRVPGQWVQTIRSGARIDRPDPQRLLHSDTFHPTMKAWLFLDDVDERNGPFTYVPGSHRLSRARLAWEYGQSLAGRDLPELYAARGSLRIDPHELAALGLGPPRALHCRRNTLVVADTRGFHCRGAAGAGRADRLELWAMSRTNPFNPLPGLPFAALDQLDLALFKAVSRIRPRLRRLA